MKLSRRKLIILALSILTIFLVFVIVFKKDLTNENGRLKILLRSFPQSKKLIQGAEFVQNLPDKYLPDQAKNNGDIVDMNGRYDNLEKLDEFIKSINERKKATIRIVEYSVEGDAIVKGLNYDGEIVRYIYDNSRDAFGPRDKGISVIEGAGLKKENEIKTYNETTFSVDIYYLIGEFKGNEKREIFRIMKNQIQNPFVNVKINDVSSITKRGGLPFPEKWPIFTLEKSLNKITKIINILKSVDSDRKSTEDDMDFFNRRHGYPVDIVINMKDGSEFIFTSAKKVIEKKLPKSTELIGTTYKDRFILIRDKNGIKEYYTIFSNEVAEYIMNTSIIEFPRE